MATTADQRLTELLDRWLTSLDLHLKYSSLDDDSYWKIQPWVEHQRPARWILDLARQKTIALKEQVEQRGAAGDVQFGDALEQMMFLANLVGLQHIERFIPVAEPTTERSDVAVASTSSTGTREMPRLSTTASGTHEMPRPPASKPRATEPTSSPLVARAERKAGSLARSAAKTPVKAAARAKRDPPVSDAALKQVLADALRLLKWGRKWYELAELIARIADRPATPEVRRMLDENRAKIEKAVLESKS